MIAHKHFSTQPSREDKSDLRPYLHLIKVVKTTSSEYHCKCPHCEDGGFKVSKKDGKWHCFKNGCTPKQVLDVIKPREQSYNSRHVTAPKAAPKLELAKLPADRTYPDKTEKNGKTLTIFEFSQTQQIHRIEWIDENGESKKITIPHHLSKGKWEKGRGNELWPAYREEEAIKYGKGKIVTGTEGEKCVELYRELGYVAISFQGAQSKKDILPSLQRLKDAGVKGMIYHCDYDGLDKRGCRAGDEKGKKLEAIGREIGFPVVAVSVCRLYPNLPDCGSDIEQVIDILGKAETVNWIERLLSEFKSEFEIVPAANPGLSLTDKVVEFPKSKSKEFAAIIETAATNKLSTRDLEKLKELQEKEQEIEESRPDAKRQIDTLLKIEQTNLDLNRFLPPALAKPLTLLSKWMRCEPQVLLTTLLPVAASLVPVESRVIGHAGSQFIEPFIIYAAIVAESGSGKSPRQRAIIRPLKMLQAQEDERYRLAQESYDQENLEFNRLSKEEKKQSDPPVPPAPPREYLVVDVTNEAVNNIKGQQPDKGFVRFVDELSAQFNSYNMYRGGKGADKESGLSGWNGDGAKINRAGGKRISILHDAMSIVGGIQFDTLAQFMGDLRDTQGEWGRFLWCNMPMKANPLPDYDAGGIDTDELLMGLYKKIDAIEAKHYKFNRQTYERFQQWHWQLEQKKVKERRQGARAAIAKLAGYTLRLAGILHILWEVGEGREPAEEIPIERLESAIELVKFYWGQVELIQSQAPQQDSLTPALKKILDMAKQGPVKPRDVVQCVRNGSNRYKSSDAHQLFTELEQMGFGKIEKNGRTIEFKLSNVDVVDVNVDVTSTFENIDIYTSQPNVDVVDVNVDVTSTFAKTSSERNQKALLAVTENQILPKLTSTTSTLSSQQVSNPDGVIDANVDVLNVDVPESTSTTSTFEMIDDPEKTEQYQFGQPVIADGREGYIVRHYPDDEPAFNIGFDDGSTGLFETSQVSIIAPSPQSEPTQLEPIEPAPVKNTLDWMIGKLAWVIGFAQSKPWKIVKVIDNAKVKLLTSNGKNITVSINELKLA